MNKFNVITKYLILEEATIQSIVFPTVNQLVMTIEVSEWNFTKQFYDERNLPIEHEAAYEAIAQVFPDHLLKMSFSNVITFRWERSLAKLAGSAGFTMDTSAWTIIDCGFDDESKDLGRMKELGLKAVHLLIDTSPGTIDIVCEDIEVLNFAASVNPNVELPPVG
jgi:hypothetical protein